MPKFLPDDFAQEKNEHSRTALFVLGEICQWKKGASDGPFFFSVINAKQIDVFLQ